MRPIWNRRHSADIFKCIFLNENVLILTNISPKFIPKGPINNIPALVQIMAWHRTGNKLLSEPMMIILLTHICITHPQWAKWLSWMREYYKFLPWQHVNHILVIDSLTVVGGLNSNQFVMWLKKKWYFTLCSSCVGLTHVGQLISVITMRADLLVHNGAGPSASIVPTANKTSCAHKWGQYTPALISTHPSKKYPTNSPIFKSLW